jgi:hypothetical protein
MIYSGQGRIRPPNNYNGLTLALWLLAIGAVLNALRILLK